MMMGDGPYFCGMGASPMWSPGRGARATFDVLDSNGHLSIINLRRPTGTHLMLIKNKLRLLALLLLALITSAHAADKQFRPPAVPLITHDPYFSIWSASDQLNTDWPRHWTGTINAMCGLIRIDGKPFRYM